MTLFFHRLIPFFFYPNPLSTEKKRKKKQITSKRTDFDDTRQRHLLKRIKRKGGTIQTSGSGDPFGTKPEVAPSDGEREVDVGAELLLWGGEDAIIGVGGSGERGGEVGGLDRGRRGGAREGLEALGWVEEIADGSRGSHWSVPAQEPGYCGDGWREICVCT